MLKLLIAEDEKLERDAIRFLINKYFGKDFTAIYEAKNGQEALQIAMKEKPDLIFMDIQMPLLDGLDAAEQIRLLLPDVEFIILTAYSYFDYARKAIKIPVNDYLLKPIPVDAFKISVGKAIKDIKNKYENQNRVKRLKEQMNNFRPLMHKNIIHQIIRGTMNEWDYNNYFELYDLAFKEYFCLIIEINEDNHQMVNLYQPLYKKLSFGHVDVIGECHLMKMIYFIFSEKNLYIDHITKEIISLLDEHGISQYYMGISQTYDEKNPLNICYNEADQKISDMIKQAHNPSPSLHLELKLYDSIINENLELTYQLLNAILNAKKNIALTEMILYSEQLIHNLSRKITFYINTSTDEDFVQLWHQGLKNIQDILQLQQYLSEYVHHLINTIKDYRNSSDEKIVQSAIKYMNAHFCDQTISLNTVAEVINISSFYLSKLFKEVTGKNFKQHLIEMRMDFAKELLMKSQMSVKEVCQEIGYTDPNYFSRAFKKYTGASPTKYIT
ncbi:response regulator transcription factor [Vallitalea okinawensis]|uniref:response regulator transcription factor n=1 Tax=Vallitalea okinawensis TaxID=2078660 RepID=UPI000CFB66C0|nr:helix-turn-helix domain-containing protein [Vallitalea okinawensis]